MNNVLEYMEGTVDRVSEKVAFSNGEESITFRDLYDRSRALGSALLKRGFTREPVVVYMKKHPNCRCTGSALSLRLCIPAR